MPLERLHGTFGVSPSRSAPYSTSRPMPKIAQELSRFLAKRDKPLEVDYDIMECIGEGSFGKVTKVREKESGKLVAAKVLHVEKVALGRDLVRIEREVRIMKDIKHDNIVNMLDAFTSTSSEVHIMLELCDTDLMKHMISHKLDPDQVKFTLGEIGKGLNYLHSKDVIHRDVKPDNILITSTGQIKIGDFGISRTMPVDPTTGYAYRTRKLSCCGTTQFMAPELLLFLPYSFNVDVWSLGVLASNLVTLSYRKQLIKPANDRLKQLENIVRLCGNLPTVFTAAPKSKRGRQVRKLLGPRSTLAGHSTDLVDLIDRMLTMDQTKRPSASDVLKHSYITEPSKINSLYRDCFEADYVIVEDGLGLPPVEFPVDYDALADLADYCAASIGASAKFPDGDMAEIVLIFMNKVLSYMRLILVMGIRTNYEAH